MTPVPPRKPLTAVDRSRYRSPPIAMIIGKIGPDATPASANNAMDTGSDGTRIAPNERDGQADRAGERETTVVKAIGELRRDDAADGDASPVERQGEGRDAQRRGLEVADQPARYADLGGHVARDREGHEQERRRQPRPARSPAGRIGPSGSMPVLASTARHRDDREEDRNRNRREPGRDDDRSPFDPAFHEAADRHRRRKRADAEEQVEEIERTTAAGLEEVEEQPVPAAVDHARAEPARQRGDEEDRPVGASPSPISPTAMSPAASVRTAAATEPFRDEAAAERTGRPGHRKQEVEQADAGVGLVERLLDRSDERRARAGRSSR